MTTRFNGGVSDFSNFGPMGGAESRGAAVDSSMGAEGN